MAEEAEWYVSDSDVDETEAISDTHQEANTSCVISFTLDAVFGGHVNSSKMIELLQRISINKCLELDCTSDYLEEREHKRRKRKRKKRDSFPDGEISETTSERISTHTASTGDSRDPRRPNLSAFEYEHEEFPALLGGTPLLKRKKPCPTRKKEPCSTPLLATIEAQLKDEERNENREDSVIDDDSPAVLLDCDNWSSTKKDLKDATGKLSSSCVNGKTPISQVLFANGHTTDDGVFSFSFDDDDDFDTSCDQEVSMFSKIRHIENFLDQD